MFAVHLEFSKNLGLVPFFDINTCNGETIIDISYGRVFLTPRNRLTAERKFLQNGKTNNKYSCSSSGVPKD